MVYRLGVSENRVPQVEWIIHMIHQWKNCDLEGITHFQINQLGIIC
jgi:hypothetical protein